MTIIIIVGAAVAGFVGGILVGRKNKALVKKELDTIKALALKAGIKL